jgi:hypothetical protein
MSYNGSGTFAINTAGQPVVTGTIISSSAFNALTADLATGLSTAITKDGQTATTVRIPFAQGINSSLVTDSTSTTTGSIITAGGVGIAKALFVGGSINAPNGTAAAPAITGTDTDSGVYFGTNTVGLATNGANAFTADATTDIFYTNGTEKARIDTSGNLLVGTTSSNPVGSRVNGAALNASGAVRSRSATGDSYFGLNVTSGVNLQFYTDNGSTFVTGGNISTNGATTAYSATSDYRLKNNVQPLTSALSRVSQLRPVTWTWKEGYGGTQPNCEGFIAHELHEILPIAVTGEKDAVDAEGNPQYQGIDTSFLVATLTAAIQEQQALITSLTDRIAALEAR